MLIKGKMPMGFGGLCRLVAELVEPDEGGPGVAGGADIRRNDQYGITIPQCFFGSFFASKKNKEYNA